VRGYTRVPDNLKGNPEVRCLVKLLPTGEVQSVQVTKSSGNLAYDEAVVRAIEKSSPLPLPADRDARAAFVPELSFVHRPKE
ncbi:MAG: putative TonB protein, partial [Proteobacteria bacterium]|nr:putative TonB protein [Pseudomonadota bacterium]